MNPYLQYFIGLPAFQHETPFDQSTMTVFRKCIPVDLLTDLNDFIAGRRNSYAPEDEDEDVDHPDGHPPETPGGGTGAIEPGTADESINQGTLILDATFVPHPLSD